MADITWTNEKRKLGDLMPWKRNPRQIKKAEGARLAESLDTFGQIHPIAIGPDDEIYDGHQRQLVWSALDRYGAELEVDVRVSSRTLTEREREQLVVFLHRGTVAEWDWDVLANEFEVGDLLEWGFSDAELGLAGLDLSGDEPLADPGPQVDRADELREKWGVELGQVWELGVHRVVCGDCTDGAMVNKVLAETKANIIVTDPPWGVGYDGGTKIREKLSNDEDASIFFRFLPLMVFQDDTPFYCWFALGMSEPTFKAFRENGWEIRSIIIWNKNQAQFGALSAHYKEKKEPLIYAHRRGKSPRWRGPTNEVTVWDCDRKSANKLHPTEKPVELHERILNNSSDVDGIVLDPFLGSGTTLIACERLGRHCRGIEIEPKYVAVTLERWHEMTGEQPRLIDTILTKG